ncbi:hypothetical protein [Spongiactinospora sp. TRM90649]|uniref:hypothetical protein n=1 Tax=Spongiactinospora sp. TRM90649 TaxID=3031114 RepID=UPI0023F820B0|nr:hypothetical protein [Spongiactinospora sp. TRM90649]MDF5759305.1 hypothetical protein [Spongiactinospora sp. TRM90649]
MDPDTFRDDLRQADPEIYWRRRMALLVAVLVVVAVVAWACSSTSGAHRPSGAQAIPTGPDPLAALAASPKPGPSANAGEKGRRAQPTPTPGRPAVPTATASAAVTAATTLSPNTVPSPPRQEGDPCAKGDLVVSLSGERQVYPGGTRPRFTLTLVNTGDLMCKTDVGPRALEVRITSGKDRIWSSSDCISGDGIEIRRLERGIPYVRPIEWDRLRSGSRCDISRAGARPGTYVAAVHADDLGNPGKAVFHLR